MKGVWRPERRNRKIGTKASGFSKSNDIRIPNSWLDKHGKYTHYYERLGTPHVERVIVGKDNLLILYETPQDGFSYGCSPPDVVKLLTLVSKFVPVLPEIIAFRQPTKKQLQQRPVWGRFLYFAEFGPHCGSAIVLEAQELGGTLKWPKRMASDDQAEYERLLRDGHSFVETKRHYITKLTEETIRGTELYRTLLHEIGHLADYHQKVLDDETALDRDEETAKELYFSRPVLERETFAHRYADDLREKLIGRDAIPFTQQPFTRTCF